MNKNSGIKIKRACQVEFVVFTCVRIACSRVLFGFLLLCRELSLQHNSCSTGRSLVVYNIIVQSSRRVSYIDIANSEHSLCLSHSIYLFFIKCKTSAVNILNNLIIKSSLFFFFCEFASRKKKFFVRDSWNNMWLFKLIKTQQGCQNNCYKIVYEC